MNRKKEIEQERAEFALWELDKLGYSPDKITDSEINFEFNGDLVRFYPYTGWATGKSIKDCRGINKLLNQLKQKKS